MISPSGCGVFGVLRKPHAPKIQGDSVVRSIDAVSYRGSDKGAGFAVFNLEEGNYYYLKAFFLDDPGKMRIAMESQGLQVIEESIEAEDRGVCSCSYKVSIGNIAQLRKAVRNLNEMLWPERKGRIYSMGKSLQVFKGVGYPKDIAKIYDVNKYEGDMWLAHTRQPTNSPGSYPYWSHPFSSFDVAIVHNGDVSSFGANLEFLQSRGWGGFVGTDSEVMAFLFEELISEGLTVEEVAKILVNPSRRTSAISPHHDYLYRNARLDGPFTAVIGYDSGDDLYLVGLADRSKFRPVLIGEDDYYYYIASEESQIRLMSREARVWTLSPGSYFIASLRKGILSHGRELEEIRNFSPPPTFVSPNYDIDATAIGYKDLDKEILRTGKKEVKVVNVLGHRFIGIKFPRGGLKVRLYGVVGNAMANLNENNEFYVYGNVADDCCDTMHGGKVVITGDARDVLAQTLQGGKVFVGGNAGNRVGIQMREYANKRPYLVIGGRVDDYLGEYMAGGVIMVLGMREKGEKTGNFVGTGMVGGKIYVRGRVDPGRIGMQPNRLEVMRLLKALAMEGYVHDVDYNMSYIDVMKKLEGEAKKYAKRLFEEKVGIPTYEYRELSDSEFKEVEPIIREYDQDLGTRATELLSEKFTVIYPSKEK
ncbi:MULTISPECIES: glutamate synthase [Metallosphaera]|uniref:Glutamate synthase (NADPH) GltB1 subunit n=3 Tax=Metallosphaera TaxID=41980 RepID=A4YHX3_METS5|nr:MULTISPECIES: glutamate synthase [Metallosphaera]ABP96025.1 glutamate synthase (NADPH) GltB1 subunit [Metallosphaera sedula DSM 5348]AIM28009.1 glutamate synthase (NADPH) GltB1 subunit [Metallosphaera sedula]AKV74841.1 glutamate synthase [Metallosphaera sedula]AKV77077.1 glutamate synthase [Metallosphaera sedula]AKV79329.1 glutamate synthase [Metallosphaera sedula]